MEGTLERGFSYATGTFGRLVLSRDGVDFVLCTLEPAWADNLRGVSCIPPGRYQVAMAPSSKGRRYRLANVPGRSGILIHSGNWAGSVGSGMRSDSKGCILVGGSLGILRGQHGVVDSRVALEELEEFFEGAPFELVISGPPGVGWPLV